MFYELPGSLKTQIDRLESLIEKHRHGFLDAASLKVHRVPFGCYEQRSKGTFMLRIRATGGAVTPSQLAAIARISERHGAETVRITTRQEFQIHDIALENVIPAMRGLWDAGLSTRGGGGNTVRNIVVSPDAGVATDEIFDPSPYAFALTSLLMGEPDSWDLPRNLKIAFSNSLSDTAFAQFNDIGFVASIKDDVKGFRVYTAGGLGAKPAAGYLLHDFIPASEAYTVAKAIKRLFDRYGNRKNRNAARLRFLWQQLGEAKFRELYRSEFEAVNSDLTTSQFAPAEMSDEAPRAPIDAAGDAGIEFLTWRKQYSFKQRQPGFYSVLIPIALGNIQNNELAKLAEFLSPFGENTIRATFDRNLRLRNIPEASLSFAYEVVKAVGGFADLPPMLANSISRTGADTRKLGICLPKRALTAAEDRSRASSLDLDSFESFHINFSGGSKTCGPHHTADLGFYSQVQREGQRTYSAYGIVAGSLYSSGNGRLAQPIDSIDAHDLPEFTAEILAIWLEKQWRFASFAEYIDEEGKDDIRTICDRYHQIPGFDMDRSYYFDWKSG